MTLVRFASVSTLLLVGSQALAQDVNVLQSELQGGNASVVAITAYSMGTGLEDASQIWSDGDLSADCSASWRPQGTLCNLSDADSGSISVKENGHSGATWHANGGDTVGVIVVDACATGACDDVTFNQASVFQMFSDGKLTDVRIFAHTSTEDGAPSWDDAGWTELTAGFTGVGPGALVTNSPHTVTSPAVLALPETAARYIRIDGANNGAYGSNNYVEMRSVKLFGMPGGGGDTTLAEQVDVMMPNAQSSYDTMWGVLPAVLTDEVAEQKLQSAVDDLSAMGCIVTETTDGFVSGAYGGGMLMGADQGGALSAGAMAGRNFSATMSNATTFGGVDFSSYNRQGQFYADRADGGFVAGRWKRVRGTRGYFYGLSGACEVGVDPAAALDGWFVGGLLID